MPGGIKREKNNKSIMRYVTKIAPISIKMQKNKNGMVTEKIRQ